MRRRGVWTLKNFIKFFATYIQPQQFHPQLTMYRYSLLNNMPLGQDTQPADQMNVPVMPGTTEEVVEPLNMRKSSHVRKIQPELQEFIQPLKLKKHPDKATIEAEKVAPAKDKVRKVEEKVVTRVKAVNHLAALHISVDGVVKTPHPSAKVFEQHEACHLSQASSMLVVEGESPIIPQNNKWSNTQ